MAINTKTKRASVLDFLQPWRKTVIPTGTVDQAERQFIVNLYPGILASGPAPTKFGVKGLLLKVY